MPRLTPTGTRFRVPSMVCESERLPNCARRSIYANSRPALAIWWPLKRANRAARSDNPVIGSAISACAR